MRILFIGIGFYEYEIHIKNEFDKYGYCEYIRYLDKSFILKDDYDLIFMIKGDQLSYEDLKKFLNQFNATKILYLWDSVTRIENIENKLKLFDKTYSFDRLDTLKRNYIIFKPLFYLNDFEKLENTTTKYDLFHLGWFHSDRAQILRHLIGILKIKPHIKRYFRLTTGIGNYLKTTVNNLEDLSFIRPYHYSLSYYKKKINYSKIVLDITHPNQSGLTLRTIEAIAAEKKIITTNKDLLNYSFYNKENILFISRDLKNLSDEIIKFIENKKNTNKYDKSIKKLRIDYWLKEFIQ